MARKGYLDAKHKLDDIKDEIAGLEREAERLTNDSLVAGPIKVLDLARIERLINAAKVRLPEAERIFNAFSDKPGAPRETFFGTLPVMVSLSAKALIEFDERHRREGITKTELVRRALMAYLFPESSGEPANDNNA